jgi:hypothetical protein
MDWTFWFVPLEGLFDGRWVGRLMYAVTHGEPSVLRLLDTPAFDAAFPDGPPQFVRLSTRVYEYTNEYTSEPTLAELAVRSGVGHVWSVSSEERAVELFERDGLARFRPIAGGAWPSLPLLRALADACGSGERFVWAWCVAAKLSEEAARRSDVGGGRVGEIAALSVPEAWARVRSARDA